MRKKVQIIFTEEIPNQAKKNDIKEVTLGYFRNYLRPKGLAKLATEEEVKNIEEIKSREEEKRNEKIKELNEQKAKLKEVTLKFQEKADDKGKLFGSVSEEEIKEKLIKDGFDVSAVTLENAIKKTGKHKAEVAFPEGIKGTVKIEVVGK